ncbi:uncharacterized protein PGTG_01614 [Puccinia graminis f. sp. tritici CRL 75-36-700-3]|uniref:Uncharacterized protein n=1 Tax=Puccinia graminis f. sp. tritici (strain CRL 75-36-700-3 / race SCCL) TaxID=418459 RepID=E3JSA0_PUCGT|nr:uncharacterized protein PGTG_01614 [Puccinia graminis f. sp. tritici CRL 75-36-700-3]EFP75021.2 hypothetical protein PGTG_01614 [Puccinia graminis f. sp. tritici CRL 75-36-700-3]
MVVPFTIHEVAGGPETTSFKQSSTRASIRGDGTALFVQTRDLKTSFTESLGLFTMVGAIFMVSAVAVFWHQYLDRHDIMITAKKSLLCIALHALGASRLVLSAPMQSARAADDVAHLGRQSAGLHGEEIEQVGVGYNAAGQSSSDVQRGIGHEISEDRGNHHTSAKESIDSESDKIGDMDQVIREEYRYISDQDLARLMSSMADLSDSVTQKGLSYLLPRIGHLQKMSNKYTAWIQKLEMNKNIYEKGFVQGIKE